MASPEPTPAPLPAMDENEDWPTQGTYEYADLYSSRAEIVPFERMSADITTKQYDFVVIGAGPIGAALAYKLAKDEPRRQILLVEKNWSEPDRIVGELMQPSGCQALEEIGLPHVFRGISGVPVHGYYVAYKGEHIYIPYLKREKNPQTRYKGVSFHHGRLVMNLRAACKSRTNITCLEASVTELIADYKVVDGKEQMTKVHGVKIGPSRSSGDGKDKEFTITPKLTMVCDGITSQFRKILNDKPINLISHFCGFVLEHEPVQTDKFFDGPEGATTHVSLPQSPQYNPLPMPHNGHVLLDGSGPLLLYQMSERETRVLADLPGGVLPSESNGQLREALRTSLSKAAPKDKYPGLNKLLLDTLESAKRIRCIGNKFIPATNNRIDGAVWIGDALNVRHPLTGGGMTVGLWDIVIFSNLLKGFNISSDSDMRKLKAKWYWQRRPRAMVVNTLSVALYDLFAAESKELGLLREACFIYLGRGGKCTMDPSGFLSGLIASPLMLIYHFFSVALLAVQLRISDESTAYKGGSLVCRIYTAFYTLWVAACVMLPHMWEEVHP
ncbi:SE-domain-containing protein [Martensiomyces pterosporus]|nr:SE-domain-containing protein [Martensiomyces pterosporus]